MDLDHVHYEGSDTAFDECARAVRQDESQFLHRAADEFNVEATLASMQDFDPLRTVWEVCCRPDSSLTNECIRQGLRATRKSIQNGYDLEKTSTVKNLKQEMKEEKPGRCWLSLKCTEWTNIQNINQRTLAQVEALKRRRARARKMVRNAHSIIEEGLETIEDFKFYWEWPKNAYSGWNMDEMRRFVQRLQHRGIRLYWTEMHGCMFDMTSPDGELINKAWYVLTNDANFNYRCWTTCDYSHQHRPGGLIGMGSAAVEATGYYPSKMVKKIVSCWHAELQKKWRKDQATAVVEELHTMESFGSEPAVEATQETEDDQQVDPEQRKRAEALLHRLHRAAGHPSNKALARLCRERCMPRWLVNMALRLQCQACTDTKRGEQGILPYALGARPVPWQVVAADVMEMVFPDHRVKARFLVMTDVVMKFTSIKLIWQGPISEGGAGTDPGKKMVEAFVDGWLLHRPRPMWVVVDPQTSLSSGAFAEFMQLIGVGVSVTPGEAHWQAGSIESMIRVIKNTMKKLRNQHPELDPELCAGLAVNSHNTQAKIKGFSPVQWAYGTNANWDEEHMGPLEYNVHAQHVPYRFWMTHRLRQEAEDTWRKAQAAEAWTRLSNAAPRPTRTFHIGEWVCVWRRAIWRTRKKNHNPEPRFVGPGRIALIEPPIVSENKPGVYWVVMGTQVWRCAPEQLRHATEQEVTLEELRSRSVVAPISELLKRTSKVVDVVKEKSGEGGAEMLPGEPGPHGIPMEQDNPEELTQAPEEWQADGEQQRDSWAERRSKFRKMHHFHRPPNVKRERWRWKQLISLNENRRREGLPPVMALPPVPEDEDDNFLHEVEQYQLDGSNDIPISEESYAAVLEKIEQLENTAKAIRERAQLVDRIQSEKKSEHDLLMHFAAACEQEEEVCEMILELDDWQSFLNDGFVFAKQMMSSPKEINWKTLTPAHRKLVEESMARELCEVMQSQALKTVKEKSDMSSEEIAKRLIPMRWLLTWKPLDEYTDPRQEKQPGVIREDGLAKAKARIVLIGYKHPDLAKRDPRTGKPLLQTSPPTLSRLGRNLLLQAGALDKHLLEAADAKSAFLQADHSIGSNKVYTTAVDEILHALHVPRGTALEIVGAIYGLTNAPRVFWLDADEKLQKLGAECHGIDKCMWIFRNRHGEVCGRVGSHVDDFIIMGNQSDPDWLSYRRGIENMYRWSPWKHGQFVFAGVQLQQLQNYDITLGQEHFCNELRPVLIENERLRPKDDKMTPKELSQCRGLIMKAQWRAIQSAPQYCCRIGLAASSLVKGTIDILKEANSIVKELQKTSKDGLIFHSFSGEKLRWRDVVFLHFGDAAKRNRVDGSDTGGFITGISSPQILQGSEARMSIVDYRSFKIDRPVKGSNGSEGQALYECEDKGWKARLFWGLLYGCKLLRANSDHITSQVESLLITDSRGVYDCLSNSDSPLLGMSNAKTGVELMAVQRGLRDGSNCFITWVPSDLNVSDCMTKVSYEAFKVYALWLKRKTWVVRFEDKFVSARRQQKLRQQQGRPKHVLMDQRMPGDFDMPDENIWPDRDLA
eukprot:s497_g15.t1